MTDPRLIGGTLITLKAKIRREKTMYDEEEKKKTGLRLTPKEVSIIYFSPISRQAIEERRHRTLNRL